MTRVLLHVGLPKTGTTALQNEVFPKIAGIDYLGPKGAVGLDDRRGVAGNLVIEALKHRTRPLAEGEIGPRVRRARDWLRRLDGTLLLSEEGLTSNSRARVLGYDPVPLMPAAIRTLLPEAEIVLVLREPTDWVASMLLQRMWDWPTYVRGPRGDRPLGPKACVDHDLALAARGANRSIFGTMARFDRMLAAYRAAFPSARVHVLAYERLFGPDEGWRAAFACLLGVPVDGPSPPRVNESSDDKRRNIAERFFPLPGEAGKVERFVAAWRGLGAVLRRHPAAQAFLEAHAVGPWRAAMAAGATGSPSPLPLLGEGLDATRRGSGE